MGKGLITWLVAVLIILVMLPACGGAASFLAKLPILWIPTAVGYSWKRTAKRRCQ